MSIIHIKFMNKYFIKKAGKIQKYINNMNQVEKKSLELSYCQTM